MSYRNIFRIKTIFGYAFVKKVDYLALMDIVQQSHDMIEKSLGNTSELIRVMNANSQLYDLQFKKYAEKINEIIKNVDNIADKTFLTIKNT